MDVNGMSASDRQNRLLVAEDWKRIYQTFQNADFQSYDFENLRRVMISYLRENYPEDFNDYIESSEYLALIDLIAFLGQSISFRIDLNARDNFLELADRRESVLRLARLLSYRPKRNIPASGLLKFSTVSTTQTVYDSNGRNLSNQVVTWNDPTNSSWYDQFIKVLNAAMPSTRQFGSAELKDTVFGIPTESYRIQSTNNDVPVYSFSKAVDGRNMTFEVVSTVFSNNNEIYEEPPLAGNSLSFIYRDDGRGNASPTTGFFLMFKEGTLNQGTFTLNQPSPGMTVDVDTENINDSDIWLYKLDSNNAESEFWTQVPSLEGNNVIYNSLKKTIRNIYGVITRTGDKASLIFSDGVFGNLPKGTFRVYYRSSNGLNYTINPKDIRNVTIDIPYISNLGQQETLTISLSLQSSVSNSSPSESSDNIKARAPATYYTQNRMITAEDYNISPLSVSQQVVKVKAVNRSSSGISRYFDLVDPTGKYSKTNLFADDGVLYTQLYTEDIKFKYSSRIEIAEIIQNQIQPMLSNSNLKNFYYANFKKIELPVGIQWSVVTQSTNQTTGYFTSIDDGEKQPLGSAALAGTDLQYFKIGALVKFSAPAGQYFDRANNNALTAQGSDIPPESTTTLWCKVVLISGNGTINQDSGAGPVVLNDIIPSNALLTQIIPAWSSTLGTAVEDNSLVRKITDLIYANKSFGLRFDTATTAWSIVTENNLNPGPRFSENTDTSNTNLDSSWLLMFVTDTEYYTVTSRRCRYIFESDRQVRFFFDSSDKIYDTRSNTTVKDKIRILSANMDPTPRALTDGVSTITYRVPFTYDRDWEITEEYRGIDGYVDTKKIQITFNDADDDGVVDDPTIFTQIVDQQTHIDGVPNKSRYVVLEKYVIDRGQEDYRYVSNHDNKVIIVDQLPTDVNNYAQGQCFYRTSDEIVYTLVQGKFSPTLNYRVFVGRDKLRFQYIHNADYESRIDPGITNIVDIYILTKQYDIEYRQWVSGTLTAEPRPPSTDYLHTMLSPELNKIKTISDEIIFHPVKYKVLFGKLASDDLQATFKVIKNPEVVISDNDIKTKVQTAISEFFALENWEFGDNFYFSELSAYVMTKVSPNLVNFTIVPRHPSLVFGSLHEIRSEKDQIFINGSTVDDIEIIPTITATSIKSSGSIGLEKTVLVRQS